MKKYLAGLIFLISSFAQAMELKETIKTEKSNFSHFNTGIIFAVFPFPGDLRKEPNQIVDESGLSTIALILNYLNQKHVENRTVLEQLVVNAWKRFNTSISTQNDEIKKEIDSITALFNNQSDQRLIALQKFVLARENNFSYMLYQIIIEKNKTTGKETKYENLIRQKLSDLNLALRELKEMPPLVIDFKKGLDVDVCEKGFSPKLSREVTINKSFDDPEDKFIKAFATETTRTIPKGTPEYDLLLNTLRAVDAAFPIFNRKGKEGKAEIALLSEENMKKLTSGDDPSTLNNLKNLFSKKDNDDASRFVLPKDDGEPLYLVWALEYNLGSINRYWIFEIQSMPSPNDTEIKARIVLNKRYGSKASPALLGALFCRMTSMLDEIDCF